MRLGSGIFVHFWPSRRGSSENEGNESSVKPKNSFTVPERKVTRSQTRMPAGVEKLKAKMWL